MVISERIEKQASMFIKLTKQARLVAFGNLVADQQGLAQLDEVVVHLGKERQCVVHLAEIVAAGSLEKKGEGI